MGILDVAIFGADFGMFPDDEEDEDDEDDI